MCLYKVKKKKHFLGLKLMWGKCFINLWKTSLLCDQQNIYACLGNFVFHSAKCHSFVSFTCKTLRSPLIEKYHISINPHLVLYIASMIQVFFFSYLSINFVFLIYFFQSMIWPFLALQLLFVCVPSFRQVRYWYTIDS